MKASALLAASLLLAASSAHAAELVRNGGFQTGGSEVADGWSLTGLAWIMGAGTANDWTGGRMTTRVLNLGGYTNANDGASQTIATAGYGRATLTFDLLWEDLDPDGGDAFSVAFGGAVLETIDIGATPGDGFGNFYAFKKSYDLTPYLDGSPKALTFTGTNDAAGPTPSLSYVDNVSIQAQPVPEPATLLVVAGGLGAASRSTLGRRRTRSAS